MPNLMKMARAVDGDDFLRLRVSICARYFQKALTDHMMISVALAVEALIDVDENGTVSSARVTDDAIIAAVQSYVAPAPVAAVPGPTATVV